MNDIARSVSALIPLVLILVIGGVAVVVIPLKKALQEQQRRLDARDQALVGSGEAQALRAELEDVKARVVELEERVDFTERVLTRGGEARLLRDESRER